MFDSRQLQRWGISETRLPAGSEILYRPRSLWARYRFEIGAAAAALLIQAVLIGGLLVERRRRRRAEGEARELLSELTLMNRRAGASELSAAIAHETLQPVAAIVANAEAGSVLLRQAEPAAGEMAELLRDIAADGRRAAAVIRSLQGLFKSEALKPAPNDLNELCRETLGMMRTELERHGVSTRFALAEGLPPVLVERIHAQQVILNLVRNAIDALQPVTDRPRVLTVRTEAEEGGGVLLTVVDSGVGIDPEKLGRIFDPFFTTKPKGTGMGLTICHSIVKAHGGQLTAAQGKPHGMVFRVKLPRAAAAGAKAPSAAPAPA
jgi:signal transduction histidine kinase